MGKQRARSVEAHSDPLPDILAGRRNAEKELYMHFLVFLAIDWLLAPYLFVVGLLRGLWG